MDDPITPASQLIRTIPLRQTSGSGLSGATDQRASSRRTMRAALDKIGAEWTVKRMRWRSIGHSFATSTPAAIRARLAAEPTPRRRQTSCYQRPAWRSPKRHGGLGLMSAEAYQRAVDLENIKGETLPAGRDLSSGEIKALAEVFA